jgi:hypothetical protein
MSRAHPDLEARKTVGWDCAHGLTTQRDRLSEHCRGNATDGGFVRLLSCSWKARCTQTCSNLQQPFS